MGKLKDFTTAKPLIIDMRYAISSFLLLPQDRMDDENSDISLFCLNAVDGKLTFVLNITIIIIIIIIIIILAPASTLSAGY